MRNYKTFFAICKHHGWDYKEKVAEFTEGRTDSLRELSDREYHELLMRAQRFVTEAKPVFTPKPGDKQRKKMLSIAGKMYPGENTKQLLNRIDSWCRVQKFKKPLMQHNEAELNVLLGVYGGKVLADFYSNLHR